MLLWESREGDHFIRLWWKGSQIRTKRDGTQGWRESTWIMKLCEQGNLKKTWKIYGKTAMLYKAVVTLGQLRNRMSRKGIKFLLQWRNSYDYDSRESRFSKSHNVKKWSSYMKQNLSNAHEFTVCKFPKQLRISWTLPNHYFFAFCRFHSCCDNQTNLPEGQLLIWKNQSEIIWQPLCLHFVFYFIHKYTQQPTKGYT